MAACPPGPNAPTARENGLAPRCLCGVCTCQDFFSYGPFFRHTAGAQTTHRLMWRRIARRVEQRRPGAKQVYRRSIEMPDYGEILRFLAQTPPQSDAERQMHASLLELVAECLRSDDTETLAEARHVRDRFPDRSMALRLS